MIDLRHLVSVGLTLSSFLGTTPGASAQDGMPNSGANPSCVGICRAVKDLFGQSSPPPVVTQVAPKKQGQPRPAAATRSAPQTSSVNAVAPAPSRPSSKAPPSSRAPDPSAKIVRPRNSGPGRTIAGRHLGILAPTHGDPDRQVAEEIVKASQQPFRFMPHIEGRDLSEQMLRVPEADLALISTVTLNSVTGKNEAGQAPAYVAKLFPQELHVLARPEVHSIEDLDGKAVATGAAGSTSAMLARDVFAALEIKPSEIELDGEAAIARVRSGALSAVVVVAGKPYTKLASIGSADGLRLLPVRFAPALQATYLPATIASADYPGLVREGALVETIAVGMVLVARNAPEESGRYRDMALFVEGFFANLPKLAASGHPKWREVNIAAVIPEAQRFEAARRWLDARMPESGQPQTTSSVRTKPGAPP